MKIRGLIAAISLAVPMLATPLLAQTQGKETKIMIRAVARDAKVIGQHVGGAKITVRDLATGEILAQGMQAAGTSQRERSPRRECRLPGPATPT